MAVEQVQAEETKATQETRPGFLPPFPKTAAAEAFNNISRTTAQSVASIQAISEASPPPPPTPPIAESGGAGDNGGMDLSQRVGHLEVDMKDVRDRLARMEPRLDAFATKGDLAETKAEIIKWVVGTAVGLGVAAITVMTFVLNNAIPKAPTAAQPAPIIINVPGAPPAQAPAK